MRQNSIDQNSRQITTIDGIIIVYTITLRVLSPMWYTRRGTSALSFLEFYESAR